jgi:hypothetical protein
MAQVDDAVEFNKSENVSNNWLLNLGWSQENQQSSYLGGVRDILPASKQEHFEMIPRAFSDDQTVSRVLDSVKGCPQKHYLCSL